MDGLTGKDPLDFAILVNMVSFQNENKNITKNVTKTQAVTMSVRVPKVWLFWYRY